MSEIVRITSNNSVITFDFNNKKVAFLRSAADKIKGRQDLVLPFSEITGIEIEKASAFLMGSVCFIANDTRFSCLYDGKKHIGEALMYQCNKKEYPTLELAVSTIAFELDIKVKAKGEYNVPTQVYDGRYADAPIEHRRRCNVCGKVFCFNEKDLLKNTQHSKDAVTSSVLQIGETLAGTRVAAYVAQSNADRAISKIVDYSKCPYCNSSDISEITNEEFQNVSKVPEMPAQTSVSSADEIKKFKDLLDSGVITQEEFDAKKKQLLGI